MKEPISLRAGEHGILIKRGDFSFEADKFMLKKGQTITTQWILPNGSKLAANTRPRTTLVEAQVKDLSGKALPTGRWRCVISAGGVVVATLSVRLK